MKLDSKVRKRIVELIKLRLTWVQIADAIGVTDRTLQNWRNQGKTDRDSWKSGRRTEFHKLIDAIDTAQMELFEGYSKVVRNAALHGAKTVTTEEVSHKDGSISTKKTTKEEPPNAALALKILGMELPEVWSDTQNVVVDWKENLESQGHDPEKIKAMVKAYLKERVMGTADDDPTTDDTS